MTDGVPSLSKATIEGNALITTEMGKLGTTINKTLGMEYDMRKQLLEYLQKFNKDIIIPLDFTPKALEPFLFSIKDITSQIYKFTGIFTNLLKKLLPAPEAPISKRTCSKPSSASLKSTSAAMVIISAKSHLISLKNVHKNKIANVPTALPSAVPISIATRLFQPVFLLIKLPIYKAKSIDVFK